jgi:hypothetical protein
LESATPEEIAKSVRQEVGRQVGDDVPVKHACILTHNMVNYATADASEKGRKGVLIQTLQLLDEIANDLGLTLTGATLQTLSEAYRTKIVALGHSDLVAGRVG